MNRKLALVLSGPIAAALLVAACGDGPDPVPTSTPVPPTPTFAVPGTPTTAPDQVVGMSGEEFDALEGIQTSSTGLRYVDVTEGDGPSPTASQQVTIHYTGTLASNGVQFDTSKKGTGQPLTLGAGQFIPGFTEALLSMKEGGTRIVYIPAALGYGSTPRTGIPANSDLIFEIELLAVD